MRSTPSLPSEDILCLVMSRCDRDLRQAPLFMVLLKLTRLGTKMKANLANKQVDVTMIEWFLTLNSQVPGFDFPQLEASQRLFYFNRGMFESTFGVGAATFWLPFQHCGWLFQTSHSRTAGPLPSSLCQSTISLVDSGCSAPSHFSGGDDLVSSEHLFGTFPHQSILNGWEFCISTYNMSHISFGFFSSFTDSPFSGLWNAWSP